MRGLTPQLSLTRGSARSPSSFADLTAPKRCVRPTAPPWVQAASASSTVALIDRSEGRCLTPRENASRDVIRIVGGSSARTPTASTARRMLLARLGGRRPAHGWSALRSLSARAGKKAARKAEKKAAQALKLTRALQREEAEAFRSGKVWARWLRTAQQGTAGHSTAQHGTSHHSTGVGRPYGYLRGSTLADLVTRCFRTSTTRPARSSSAP